MTYVELFVDQGTDYQTNMDLKRDDGTPMSVAGYSFTGQIRKSYYSTNPTANLVITAIDAPNGNLSLTMNSSVTTNIAPGRYVYDVKMMDTSNVTIRIMEGIITVTPQVSR
jgi:hypothetical protein